jgi:hypothetical protein
MSMEQSNIQIVFPGNGKIQFLFRKKVENRVLSNRTKRYHEERNILLHKMCSIIIRYMTEMYLTLKMLFRKFIEMFDNVDAIYLF